MNNIGTRIKELREHSNWIQKELAKKLNVSIQAVSAWETGLRTPNANQRQRLCELFKISEPELFGGSEQSGIPVQRIPLISWVRAGKFTEISDPYPAGSAEEWIYTCTTGENIFALRVENDSMEPEFREGDIIIIKPQVDVTSGDYIVVADRQLNKATFKQYKQYGNKIILHPLNPKYPEIELDHDERYHIVGKVEEKVKKY